MPRITEPRRECALTLPSRGRATSGFACCRPPLMSNVRAPMHMTRRDCLLLAMGLLPSVAVVALAFLVVPGAIAVYEPVETRLPLEARFVLSSYQLCALPTLGCAACGRRQSGWPVKRHSSWPVGWG